MKANTKCSTKSLRRSVLWLAMFAAMALGPALSMAGEAADEEAEADDPVAAKALKDLTEVGSEVEVGICYVNDDSFRFGRYNGLDSQGAKAVLDFELQQRGPYDGNSAEYWSFVGRNLGLDTREAEIAYGVQGRFDLRLNYDEIPMRRSDDTQTIFDGAGGNVLTLPSGWVAAQNTAGLTRLLPSLRGVDLQSERRRVGVGADGQINEHWSIVSDFKRERKDGIKSLGAVFGNSGGNPRAVLIPEPIDYTTDQIDVAARYFTKKFQFQLSYYASIFKDNNSFVSFQNPYSAISGWTAVSGYPTGVGQMSTPPDNQFHQISLDGGYNLSDTTRLSASYARGRMSQNDQFLAYTAIPSLASQITTPLPRDSLDGRIDTTVAMVRLSSRAWDKLFWNATFRYDDRDNKTPRDQYIYIGGDTQVQPTTANSDRIRYNEPYSYKNEQFKFDAGYRIYKRTELGFSAEHSKIDRTYSEREQADENSYKFELRSEFADWISGNLRWTHAKRDGSTYNGAEPLATGFAPEFAATLAGGFENIPALRKFNQADRTRDIGSAYIAVTPIPTLTVSGGVDYALDDYNKSEIGLTLARTRSYTANAVYAPAKEWSVYGWYTHEKMDSDQAGRSISGTTRVADSVNPLRNWFAFHRDTLDTDGIGVKHTFAKHKATLSADYVHAKTDSDIFFLAGTALTYAPLPTAKTKLDSLSLTGSCDLRDDLTIKLRYWYEKYNSNDWQLDSLVVPNTLANVITMGEASQDYKVHVVFATLTYRF